jgi:L-alanine-DL-glutamate epimerase-like enolase superfamily enzyme
MIHQLLFEALAEPAFAIEDGHLVLSSRPGLGIVLDPGHPVFET